MSASGLATSTFSLLHLASFFYTRFFVKATIFKFPLKPVKLHLFLQHLKGLFQAFLDFYHNRQGYPPFLFWIN
jgi:hypothetical protein